MLKKYSLKQFQAKDFNGYKEVMKREHSDQNRFGMIELLCGINIFFSLISVLDFFSNGGDILLIINSAIYALFLIIMLPVYYISKQKNLIIEYFNLGAQFLFFSSIIFLLCKNDFFYGEKGLLFLTDNVKLRFEISFYFLFFLSAILGYVFFITHLRKGTYTKHSSYIQYVKKNTSTDITKKYKHVKVWIFVGVLISPAIPTAFFILQEPYRTVLIGMFVSDAVMFITPFCFIAAYFFKKFPELTEDQKSKVKEKRSKKE